MAKRSKIRHTQQIKDQAGCMWGLISIFDFRNGRTTKRLLSDRRVITEKTVASANTASEVDLPTSSEERHVSIDENVTESEKPTLDFVKTSVKELMEEEMVFEQASTKQTDGDGVESFESECVKTSNKSFDNHDISIGHQASSQKASQFSDLEALMKEILLIYQRRNDRHSDLDAERNRAFSIVEEKLSAAVEAFMSENPSDEKTRGSKDLIDTFQMLSSNKELFLKLLQDQNADEKSKSKSTARSSPLENEPSSNKGLLLKLLQDQNVDQKSKSKSSPLENEPSSPSPSPDAPVARKQRNFFRKRSKSHENLSLKEPDGPKSSRIVILKPNSPENRLKAENDVQSERISTHFSFMEIKKRLKNVIGKEQPKPGGSERTLVEGSNGWSSPNRDHFYTERFAKRIERVSKLREPETEQKQKPETGEISSIYIEAKKHLSELVNMGDEDAELMIENLPKTLGRILSVPEYNSLSPGTTPRKENEHSFVNEQTRPSPCGNSHTVNESQPCETSVDLEEKPEVLDEVNHDIEEKPEVLDEVNHDIVVGGALQIDKPGNEEDVEVVDVSCEPCSSESMDDDQHDEIVEVYDEERSPECSKSDSSEENEFSSPIESSHSKKIEEPESNTSDRTGRPSPVSVLEPLFSDNELSPASTISRPVESPIQPLCIRFDDQETCTRNCIETEESAFEYIEAVLLASDLNWIEFEKRWISSSQILDSSLFDEVEIFSSRPAHDQRLLFDSTNEILNEVCDCYLNHVVLRLSFIKRNIQPVPKGQNLINEVWERIESRLNNNYHHLSLDHLVKKDLGISKTWMDLRSNTREIVCEIDESIFDDMIDDTVLTLVNDGIDQETFS